MNGRDLAVVQGWEDTRATLRAWNARPFAVLARWVGFSLAISILLLFAVSVIASHSTPDATMRILPGVNAEAGWDHVLTIVGRNSLVLALHSMACLAGFIAKSSLPIEAQSYEGRWRAVHDFAGPAAVLFVTGATLFSLCTQAFVLGEGLAALSWQLGVGQSHLLATLSIHALPELTALFLPLAAWLVAARVGAWHQLLAATIVTTVLAAPVIVIAAMIEVFVTPRFL